MIHVSGLWKATHCSHHSQKTAAVNKYHTVFCTCYTVDMLFCGPASPLSPKSALRLQCLHWCFWLKGMQKSAQLLNMSLKRFATSSCEIFLIYSASDTESDLWLIQQHNGWNFYTKDWRKFGISILLIEIAPDMSNTDVTQVRHIWLSMPTV